MNFLYKTICSALGLGYIPFAPGTFGAFGGIISAWLIKEYSPFPNLILVVLIFSFTLIGAYCSNKLTALWGEDPSKVVIDEVTGMWLSLWLLPNNWIIMAAAFVLFRFFDIKKPFLIRKLEKIPGGWGIMLDDLAAGFLTNIILQIAILFWYD